MVSVRPAARVAITTALTVATFAGSAAAAAPVLLPTGRALTPAGRMVAAGDFPAAALLDGTRLIAPADGMSVGEVASTDAGTLATTAAQPLPLQLSTDAAPWALSGSAALAPGGGTVYLGAGRLDQVDVFTDSPFLSEQGAIATPGWAGGVAVSQDGRRLFVTLPFDGADRFNRGSKVVALPTALAAAVPGLPPTSVTRARPLATATVGRNPLAIIDGVAHGREFVAVGAEDSGTVTILDPVSLATIATVATGRHPAALALTPDGSELLVTDSLDDSVAVLDTADWHVAQRVGVGSRDGLGAAPSAVTVTPDGRTAYVALSQDNTIAVLTKRAAGPRGWRVSGRIPTAWYPTGVAFDAAHGQLLVTAGKGVGGEPGLAPGTPVRPVTGINPGSSGVGGTGVVEAIPLPSAAGLAALTAQSRADNSPACDGCRDRGALAGIRHVVYIVRENKTYDEEFGDLAGGAPAGLLYGSQVTPNAHAIATRWPLLERFYADEEVSDTGHQALMGGVANDWVERFTQQAYGLDGAPRPGAELGNDTSVLWSPSDYLFDDALAHGISFRDYGEFYRRNQTTDGALTPELESHIVHGFPGSGFDPSLPDTVRAAYWLKDFRRDVAADTLPSLEVIYLPEDHTTQGLPSTPSVAGTIQSTPQWQVADSDLATGQIISALSHSPYWGSTAVFLTEDDPQSGIDHVNEHRTVGLVAGGRVRTALRTTRHFDQAGMLRTIEEILGLPPLTEFDARATPMDSLFTRTTDLTPFDAITPQVTTLAPAAIRAINARAEAALGGHPDPATIAPATQLRLQWQAVRGVPFTLRPRRAHG